MEKLELCEEELELCEEELEFIETLDCTLESLLGDGSAILQIICSYTL